MLSTDSGFPRMIPWVSWDWKTAFRLRAGEEAGWWWICKWTKTVAKAQFRFLFVLQVWILRALSISSWKEAVNGTSLFPELVYVRYDICYSAVVFLGFDFYAMLMWKSKSKENAAKIDYSAAVELSGFRAGFLRCCDSAVFAKFVILF